MRGEKGIRDFFFRRSNRTGSGASSRQRKAPLQRSE